jgi:hypothetical protein
MRTAAVCEASAAARSQVERSVLCGNAAAGRDDTAALRVKMRTAGENGETLCKSMVLFGNLGFGAGEGNRTLVSGLGSLRSTIEPHPLYLSGEFLPRELPWRKSFSDSILIF